MFIKQKERLKLKNIYIEVKNLQKSCKVKKDDREKKIAKKKKSLEQRIPGER